MNNKTTKLAISGRCIKRLDSLDLYLAHFETAADRRIWADALLTNEIIPNLSKVINGTWTVLAICDSATAWLGGCFAEEAWPTGSCGSHDYLWSESGTGAEVYTNRIRNCWKCLDSATRCRSGYYGLPYMNNNVCSLCPSLGGTNGTTPAGSVSVSECYIPGGGTYSDARGTFVLQKPCYYSE